MDTDYIDYNAKSLVYQEKHSATRWFVRQYENDYDMAVPEGGFRDDALVYDKDGKVLNTLVWEDPQIAKGTNFNVITDAGKQMVFNTILQLAGSGAFPVMAYGACSTASSHVDTKLNYEHILDATRVPLTNSSATQMTSGSVVSLSTFNDTSYTPTLSYYVQAAVMATINGATTNNKMQPVREFGLASTPILPSTPTGSSGTLLNHFTLGADSILTNTTTLQVLCQLIS